MKNKKYLTIAFVALTFTQTNSAQNQPAPPPPPAPRPASTIPALIAKNLPQIMSNAPVPRERRQEAYTKLLEGQRSIWNLKNQRTRVGQANAVQVAKQAFQKSIEINPMLAEGYTALAEWSELEDGIALANVAVRLDPDSFGAHRILARLYTFKSRLNKGILDTAATDKAIAEWREIGRLDPRNAEAFAFLSEFFARTKKPTEQLEALRRWQSATPPLDSYFYRRVMGDRANLSPDGATLKYGQALLETGELREAISIISRAVADNPEDEEAVELLRRTVETSDVNASATAVTALQQAVFANPENSNLVIILAQLQARSGKTDDAAKVLRDASGKIAAKDKNSAAELQISLGDVFVEAKRFDEAIAAFENALTTRGVTQTALDAERDFAIRVFERMIDTYKKANRPNDAKNVIDRARLVLGKADLFADKRLIQFYIETGKKPEALQALHALRQRQPEDYQLLQLEATMLTESGKVDEAVALVKPLIGRKPATQLKSSSGNGIVNSNGIANGDLSGVRLPAIYDDFSHYLFIANLYSQAKRGKDAIEAVRQATNVAQTSDRKEIARLTLATIQQANGDFEGSEKTLRDILQLSPRNPIALNNLGYFLSERDKNFDEALKLIEQAIEIDPLNSSYLDSLGWVYFKLGKFTEAEKYLKDALQIDDSSATIHEHLGDVYNKQGKTDLAKDAWEKALKLTSDTEEINRIKTKLDNKKAK